MLMNVRNNQESVTTTASTLGGHFAAAVNQASLSTKTTGRQIALKQRFTMPVGGHHLLQVTWSRFILSGNLPPALCPYIMPVVIEVVCKLKCNISLNCTIMMPQLGVTPFTIVMRRLGDTHVHLMRCDD